MLIVLESVKADIQTAVNNLDLKISVELVGIPSGEDWGTADSLRFVEDKIKCDVVVVSCDLVTDFNLSELLHVFRKHQASLATLFFRPSQLACPATPGSKAKHKPERDLVALDNETSRLVFLASMSDFEESVPVSRNLLRKHHCLSVHSNLLDSHVYVLRSWLCRFLSDEKSFSTLKGELLPYIVKKQLMKPPPKKDVDVSASVVAVDSKKEILQYALESDIDTKIRSMSFYNDHSGDLKPTYHGDPIRCYSIIANQKTFGMRANTLPAYFQINAKVVDAWPAIAERRELVRIHPTSEVLSTQVDDKCLVGAQSHLAEKTSFKASHIGPNCHIETKVRLSNCVLMSGVKIAEGSVLSNCIVCDEAVINSRVDLKDCLVGSNHVVLPGAKHANEMLTDVDTLMEI
ncbi:translation initiation factor eIF2B subunit gamma isoform X2 [Bacillus rossius redtenbacheri]